MVTVIDMSKIHRFPGLRSELRLELRRSEPLRRQSASTAPNVNARVVEKGGKRAGKGKGRLDEPPNCFLRLMDRLKQTSLAGLFSRTTVEGLAPA